MTSKLEGKITTGTNKQELSSYDRYRLYTKCLSPIIRQHTLEYHHRPLMTNYLPMMRVFLFHCAKVKINNEVIGVDTGEPSEMQHIRPTHTVGELHRTGVPLIPESCEGLEISVKDVDLFLHTALRQPPFTPTLSIPGLSVPSPPTGRSTIPHRCKSGMCIGQLHKDMKDTHTMSLSNNQYCAYCFLFHISQAFTCLHSFNIVDTSNITEENTEPPSSARLHLQKLVPLVQHTFQVVPLCSTVDKTMSKILYRFTGLHIDSIFILK